MKLEADINKKRNNLANGVNIFLRSDILYNCHILITVSVHTPKQLKMFWKLLSLIINKKLIQNQTGFFVVGGGNMFKWLHEIV